MLTKINVEQKVDLPGVGESYQDHNVCFVPYKAADYADTLDFVLRNETDAMERTSLSSSRHLASADSDRTVASNEWLKNGQNIMAHKCVFTCMPGY